MRAFPFRRRPERPRRAAPGNSFIGRGYTARMVPVPAPGAEPPLVVYDDLCGPCTSFASAVGSLAGGRIPLVGHHTELGRRLRGSALGGDSALDMFWLVEDETAYGGRSALLPLLRAVLSSGSRPHAGALARPARDSGGARCGPSPGPGTACGCGGGPSSAVGRAAGLLARRGRTLPARGPAAGGGSGGCC